MSYPCSILSDMRCKYQVFRTINTQGGQMNNKNIIQVKTCTFENCNLGICLEHLLHKFRSNFNKADINWSLIPKNIHPSIEGRLLNYDNRCNLSFQSSIFSKPLYLTQNIQSYTLNISQVSCSIYNLQEFQNIRHIVC